MLLRLCAQRPVFAMVLFFAIAVAMSCGLILAEQPAGCRLSPPIDVHLPCPSCPDDYCRKPMPPPPFLTTCFGAEVYLAKPMPPPPFLTTCFGTDDYVVKPMPVIGPLPCRACDTCGPASSSGDR